LFIFSGALGHMCWVVFLGMFWGDVGRRQTIGRWEQGMILSFKQCDEEVFTCYEYGG
jgi:Na+/proline symporter